MTTPNITSSSPNVWLARDPALARGGDVRDVQPAEEHGTLMRPIFDRSVSPFDVGKQQEVIRESVLPYAKVTDLVLTVGPQVMVVVLSCLFVTEFGQVNLLVWDHNRKRYVVKFVRATTTGR
jgi:hypothetical protein